MHPDLSALGLSHDEGALYLLLLDRQAATVTDLAQGWEPRRGSVGSLLRELHAKGLVTRLAGSPVRHAAIAPDVALDNLATVREQEITAARTQVVELTERWRRAGRTVLPDELVEVVVGREATVQRSEQIQRAATHEVLIVDAPPYAGRVVGNTLEADLLARGAVAYRCLYDRSGLEVAGKLDSILTLIAHGEEARVASGLPLKLVMADDSVAMLALESAPASITAAIVVHQSALLTSLRLMFDALWTTALPVRGVSDDEHQLENGDGRLHLNDIDRRIVQLLITGMTDQAIGRQLGLAERTVQRKVRTIMQNLSVTNRLQLGIRLAQHGWVS